MRTFLLILTICSCRLNLDKTPDAPQVVDTPAVDEQTDSSGPTEDSGNDESNDTAEGHSPAALPRVVVLVLDGARIDESFGDGVSSVTGSETVTFLPEIRNRLLPQGALLTNAMNTGVTITA
ncbi:MAG: hypothetical protein ACPGTU_17150, partial [Myxococcota bacterium]